MSVIALNAMGGDHAPHVTVEGAHLAAADGLEIVLVGDESILRPMTDLTIVHAPLTIGFDEKPLKGRNKQSSTRITAELVAAGDVDAALDCGNTGAAIVAAYFSLGNFENLERATIGTKTPHIVAGGRHKEAWVKRNLLLDAGANIDTTEQMIKQWAVLGSLYMQLMGVDDPRVGLTSNGEEPTKGTPFVIACHKLLMQMADQGIIIFVGNVEGGGPFEDVADVVLSDGYTGNIQLKEAEVLAKMFKDALTGVFKSNLLTGIAYKLFIRRHLKFMKSLEHEESGSSLLLGANMPYLIGHGKSTTRSVHTGLIHADEVIQKNIVPQLKLNYEALAATA